MQRSRHRTWLASLLALLFVTSLAPAPAAASTALRDPQRIEWASGSVKVTRLGIGPSPTRNTDPLGRSGILLEPGSSCFQNWTYSWTDLHWSNDRTKVEPESWSTRAYGDQGKISFL